MSASHAPPAAASPMQVRAARTFKPHLLIYLSVNAALTAINVYMGAPWWGVWPLVLWGLLLMLHFLFYRAASVDDAWVDERILDLRSKSYDMGHIDDIRKQPAPSVRDEKGASPPPSVR
jgi:hypothetical protein